MVASDSLLDRDEAARGEDVPKRPGIKPGFAGEGLHAVQPALVEHTPKNGLTGGNVHRIEDMLPQDARDVARILAVLG